MRPLSLDHVALWVADRDPIVERCERALGMHVIERSERFTLVGSSARHGKLTLFDAEGPRDRGLLVEIGLRVSDLERARARLPPGTPERFDLGEGLHVRLVEGETEVEHDLAHVILASPDPVGAAAAYEVLGFEPRGECRLEVAGAFLELVAGTLPTSERPLLNHLAVRVDSVAAHLEEAEARGIEVDSTVEAANTRAVFLRGPDGVRIEYVEHKPGFALV